MGITVRETVHIVIPDTQIKPGVSTRHLEWVGQYIADRVGEHPDWDAKVIHLGDHFDMPSLSSYDRKGGTLMEGRRYTKDIEAGVEGLNALMGPMDEAGVLDQVSFHFLLGNHENRIQRAYEEDAQLDGLITLDDVTFPLEEWGFEVHDFLKVVNLDGVRYSHYFANPMNGRPYAGQNIETRLKTVGHSFTMGHQQTLMYGMRYLGDGTRIRGLVAGACYLHQEDYLGPQGNAHWRGIVVCHQVERGDYDMMEVSLDYLCRRYEGKRLQRYLGHKL